MISQLLSEWAPGLGAVGSVLVIALLQRAFPPMRGPESLGLSRAELTERNRSISRSSVVLFLLPLLLFVVLIQAGHLPNDQLFVAGLMFGTMVALPAFMILSMAMLRGRTRVTELLVFWEVEHEIGSRGMRLIFFTALGIGLWALVSSVPALLKWLST